MNTMTRARDLQLVADQHDDQMTAQARRRAPRVQHWWGRRTWDEVVPPRPLDPVASPEDEHRVSVPRTGAWCYLCRRPIATWSSRWPVPEQALSLIDAHRSEHISGALDSATTEHEDER